MRLFKTYNDNTNTEREPVTERNGVMIVDDSRFSRNVLRDILKNEGYEVVGEAGDGLKAIEMATELKPEIIFLDVEMPKLDGIGAIPRILEQDPGIKIIMCTALGQKKIIVEATKAGAKDYVIKPYKKENITSVLQLLKPKKEAQVIPFQTNKKHTLNETLSDIGDEKPHIYDEEKLIRSDDEKSDAYDGEKLNTYQGERLHTSYQGESLNKAYQGESLNKAYQGESLNKAYQGESLPSNTIGINDEFDESKQDSLIVEKLEENKAIDDLIVDPFINIDEETIEGFQTSSLIDEVEEFFDEERIIEEIIEDQPEEMETIKVEQDGQIFDERDLDETIEEIVEDQIEDKLAEDIVKEVQETHDIDEVGGQTAMEEQAEILVEDKFVEEEILEEETLVDVTEELEIDEANEDKNVEEIVEDEIEDIIEEEASIEDTQEGLVIFEEDINVNIEVSVDEDTEEAITLQQNQEEEFVADRTLRENVSNKFAYLLTDRFRTETVTFNSPAKNRISCREDKEVITDGVFLGCNTPIKQVRFLGMMNSYISLDNRLQKILFDSPKLRISSQNIGVRKSMRETMENKTTYMKEFAMIDILNISESSYHSKAMKNSEDSGIYAAIKDLVGNKNMRILT